MGQKNSIIPNSLFKYRYLLREGICLSVKGLTNGAVAVLYPEVIKKLVELMDGDFYVVFSSVHEALIHSSKLCSLEELENLLRTSNSRMTFQKEFLTDKGIPEY